MVCSEVIENAECNSAKKIKTEVIDIKEEIKIDSSIPKLKSEKCIRCKQFLDSAPLYNGHPNNSNEEFIALTDEKLSLYTGKEENINENDEFPTHKVQSFYCNISLIMLN